MIGVRLSEVTASPRNWPWRTTGRIEPMFCNVMVTRPPITSVKHSAAVGHVDDIDAGLPLEQFAGDVLRGADAGRCVGQLARLRLGERDELGKAFAGTSLLTARMLGITRRRATGARSRSTS
jgi:hypothetical protein